MKAPKITYGGEENREYRPPVLFPEIGRYRDAGQQRLYVLQRIDKLAADKDLCVTDLLAQPGKIRNLIGRIIFGIDINPDSLREQRAEYDLAGETMAYEVRVKCITDNPEVQRLGRTPQTIKYKRAVVNDPRGVALASDPTGNSMQRGTDPEGSPRRRAVSMVDEVVDYGEPQATLRLRDAWICLSKHGEYCTHRKQNWLYREVDANGNPLIQHARRVETDDQIKGARKGTYR